MTSPRETSNLTNSHPPVLPPHSQAQSMDGEDEQVDIIDSPQQGEGISLMKKINRQKGKRRSKTQNLKEIANIIRFLIGSHKDLSIRELSYFLYQIVSKTQLGKELEKGRKISKQQMAELQDKYGDEDQPNQIFTAKNVRRRLYDVLNVLISTKIINKGSKTLSLQRVSLADPAQKYELERERLDTIRSKTSKLKQLISKKTKKLEMTAKRYLQLQKFNTHNESNEMKDVIAMPVAMLILEPNSQLQISETYVKVKSNSNVKILGDADLISQLFPVTKSEVNSFLHR